MEFQQLVQARLVKEQFELNQDVLIENFDGCPERILEMVPFIESLVNELMSKGYLVECAYEYSVRIPQSITIIKSHAPFDGDFGIEIKKDFAETCKKSELTGLYT